MNISLDNTNTLISVILGMITLFSLGIRKWLVPIIKNYIGFWSSFKKSVRYYEEINNYNISQMTKDIAAIHVTSVLHHHKIELLLDKIPVACFENDVDGDCVWVNEALQQLFNKSEQNLLGNKWLNCLHHEDINRSFAAWRSSVEQSIPYKDRYRIVDEETGKVTLCEAVAHPVVDEHGNILSYFGFVAIIH